MANTEDPLYKMNSECHALLGSVICGKVSDCHYILPRMSLSSSDIHFHFFIEEGEVFLMTH